LKTLLRGQPSAAGDAHTFLESLRRHPGTFAAVADERLTRRGQSESLNPEQGSADSSTVRVKKAPGAGEAFGTAGLGDLLQTSGDRQRLVFPQRH
jgi:hypothetical protein